MKSIALKSTGSWAACVLSFSLVLGSTGLSIPARAADTTWDSTEHGSVFITPPQIDATNFINYATWAIGVPRAINGGLYTTTHTLNYTNRGYMQCNLGWEFDFGPLALGGRGWAANFLNDNNATISALDGSIANVAQDLVLQSHLFVSATNIVNKGLLTAGGSGEIVLSGSNINLNRSGGVEITPITSTGTSSTSTNFTPDNGIFDLAWAARDATGNQLTIVGNSDWNGSSTGGRIIGNVGLPCGVTNGTLDIPSFFPDLMDSFYTNMNPLELHVTNSSGGPETYTIYSNIVHQAAFVYLGNALRAPTAVPLTGDIRFYIPSPANTNGFQYVAVRLEALIPNSITAQLQPQDVYLVDSFAATTNHGLLRNLTVYPTAECNDPTFRPAGYSVGRSAPEAYVFGVSYGTNPPSNFFYDPSWSNNVVQGGAFAAYQAEVGNLPIPLAPGYSVTNLPGRVRIYADTLNLNQAHIRGEGQIQIQASNLTSSTFANLDCQNLSLKLGASSGQLNVASLVKTNVDRLQGNIIYHTMVWSNFLVVVTPNFAYDTTISNWVPANLTNVIRYDLSMTTVDARNLSTTVPVNVQDLILRSTNIVITDSMLLSDSFYLSGLSATLQGYLYFSGGVYGYFFGTNYGTLLNWTYTNAPNLRYFTNNGFLAIPENAHFGDDGPTNYLVFVNNGTIEAGLQNINSVDIQLNASVNDCILGGFKAVAQTLQLRNAASVASQSDMQFFANTLKMSGNCTLDAGGYYLPYLSLPAGGALHLTVTNSLSDGGIGEANRAITQSGFNLWLKPTTGDLLGTIFYSYAPLNNDVEHYWAGQDRGVSAAGFTNNVAIGTLALIPTGSQAPGYQPLFSFYGTTGNNGLYVNNLDLSGLLDFANEVAINPGITIYYAHASLNPGVDTGGLTPEEYLDGRQFFDSNGNPGGYTRWVSVAGLAHSVPGQQGKLVADYVSPTQPLKLMMTVGSGQTNFVIEASTDLKHWTRIYTNNGPFGVFTDPNVGSYPYRFYRAASPTNLPPP